MTPSEKKARESLLSDASYLLKSVDHQYSCSCETCRQSQVERVASALSEAERRGFERAKGACIEKAKTYRHYAVKGVPTSNKIIYELENLKYEEDAK